MKKYISLMVRNGRKSANDRLEEVPRRYAKSDNAQRKPKKMSK